jgi:two-component system, cell cycle response regulator
MVDQIGDTTVTLSLKEDSPCTVLVADDDELVRERLRALLVAAGYSVKLAATGEDALKMFEAEPSRIVLSDWMMPDMDGLALCRNIRALEGNSYVYILMHTVRHGKRDAIAGLGAGADDYIVKGASLEELLARLNVGRRITSLERSLRAANRENRRMALTDALTGAGNRRYLAKHLPRELQRSRRYGHCLAVLMCDLDRFKLINDGFGHDAGDQILQAFVDRTSMAIRSSDWIVRTGGEEFAVVLPETDLTGAAAVAEKVRVAMGSKPVSTVAGPLSASVSIGYSALVNPTDLRRWSPEDLLHAADQQLYTAKHAGRNRCCGALVTASPQTPAPLKQGALYSVGSPATLAVLPSARRGRC